MANPRGFLEVRRVPAPERDPRERVRDSREIFGTLTEPELLGQAGRCMDCGVPFCNNGCPLGNLIPDWNDLVRRGKWREAIDQLHATNNFPEFTGLICPAPCESACVLDIADDPVMIKQIEYAIVHRAFEEGWIVPRPPEHRTGLTVAVIGSGPAGMAAAAELNQVGHTVTVYERDEAPGGLMRFGVPDAKLEKWMIDRRIALLEAEGIDFACGVDVGADVGAEEIAERHDAVVVAVGSRVERPLEIPGADLDGVHYAMDYLYQRNRAVARQEGRGGGAQPEREGRSAAGTSGEERSRNVRGGAQPERRSGEHRTQGSPASTAASPTPMSAPSHARGRGPCHQGSSRRDGRRRAMAPGRAVSGRRSWRAPREPLLDRTRASGQDPLRLSPRQRRPRSALPPPPPRLARAPRAPASAPRRAG
ncbi:MAG: glutamate synthase subunit beta [Actinomycetota bacterium]|nr:glutamate synthase subunit beta [Actinomycetota bacterium]